MAKGRVTTEKEEAVATGRVRTEREEAVRAAARVVAVMVGAELAASMQELQCSSHRSLRSSTRRRLHKRFCVPCTCHC